MNKVILVTGSTRGIGRSLISNFAAEKHSVIINYFRSFEKAKKLYSEILQKLGKNEVLMIKADVSKRTDVIKMFEQAYQFFGRVDVLINNAGINIDKPFLELSDEDWDTVHSTILKGTFLCSQEFALRYNGEEGHIINIGALTAIRGRKNGANYCSARAGVLNLTKCMALELAPKIKVNCVTPGWIETEELTERYDLHIKENYVRAENSIPLNKIGKPEDIYKMISFLVNQSSYVTGQNFLVDGGSLMY